jgi:thiol-disulfide isomerase/thioredoxin
MKSITLLVILFFSISIFGQTNVSDIKVKNMNLDELSLSEAIDGKRYTLLSVGGTWCKPCIDQKPFVASLGKQYPQFLKVIYLYYRDTPEKIKTTFGEFDELNDYYLVDFNSIGQLFVKAYPTNILVDVHGNIIDNDVSINDVGSLIK